ncbi:MerR family transcriptional regulator [Actinokineospora soli]
MTAVGRPTRDRTGGSATGSTIGAVLARLRPEFPDVTISKIRFLEAEGLVSPERTAAGYRRFSDADIARLRFVLAAQRDHYLPLKVIRERLDAGATVPALIAVPRKAPVIALDAPADRLGRDEVVAHTGVPPALLAELEQYGLVVPDEHGRYDTDGVQIVRMAAALGGYGLEPRHLRAFRAAADRELGLLEQVVAPLYRQRDRKKAAEQARELAGLSVGLHTLLVKTGLRRVTGG